MEEVFIEGKISQEKVFDGAVLPKTLLPAHPSRSTIDGFVDCVVKNKEWLSDVLRRHGAILFRGFDVEGASDFRRVVEAFGWEEMPYLGPSRRVKVEERIFTANETRPDVFIHFHHEMSMMREFPSKIFFYCLTPPPEGGQTSICRSSILLREMERRQPEFSSKAASVGLQAEVTFPKEETAHGVVGKTWNSLLGTDDHSEAEKRAKESMMCKSVEFKDDGSATFVFGPLQVVRTLGGEKLWFANINDGGDSIKLGDGSHIPREAVEACNEALDDISVDVTWQKGDMLLVDNWSTRHARRPGKQPRQILVSLCK